MPQFVSRDPGRHVSAVRWDGTQDAYDAIVAMVGDKGTVERNQLDGSLLIVQGNSYRHVSFGFWCVRYRDDLTGGCRPDIFQATYLQVEE